MTMIQTGNLSILSALFALAAACSGGSSDSAMGQGGDGSGGSSVSESKPWCEPQSLESLCEVGDCPATPTAVPRVCGHCTATGTECVLAVTKELANDCGGNNISIENGANLQTTTWSFDAQGTLVGSIERGDLCRPCAGKACSYEVVTGEPCASVGSDAKNLCVEAPGAGGAGGGASEAAGAGGGASEAAGSPG